MLASARTWRSLMRFRVTGRTRDRRCAGCSCRPARCPHPSVDADGHSRKAVDGRRCARWSNSGRGRSGPADPFGAEQDEHAMLSGSLRCRFRLRCPCRTAGRRGGLAAGTRCRCARAAAGRACGSRSGCGADAASPTSAGKVVCRSRRCSREEAERCSGEAAPRCARAAARRSAASPHGSRSLAVRRAVVQLGAYSNPKSVLAAWNSRRASTGRFRALHADERAVRKPERHLLSLVGEGLRQRQ